MSDVRYQVEEAAAYLTLDSPQTRNALSDQLVDDLLAALERARDDDAVRVVVLQSSHDRVFSAGGDLKAMAGDVSAIQKYAGLDRFPRLFQLIAGMPKPVLCAANGDVLAGGFGIALSCDLVIARQGVRFGCPEINVGVFPFMVSALIYRNLPRMRANELMMLGGPVDAEVGERLGFVNVVVSADDFDATVRDWVGRLVSKSPLLMGMGKQAIDASRDLALAEALALLRGQLALAMTTGDIKEGVAAFLEKRPAEWQLS